MQKVGGNLKEEIAHKCKEICEDLEDDVPSREDHSKKLMIECYYIHGHAALEYARKIPNTLQRQFLAKKNRDLRMQHRRRENLEVDTENARRARKYELMENGEKIQEIRQEKQRLLEFRRMRHMCQTSRYSQDKDRIGGQLFVDKLP